MYFKIVMKIFTMLSNLILLLFALSFIHASIFLVEIDVLYIVFQFITFKELIVFIRKIKVKYEVCGIYLY